MEVDLHIHTAASGDGEFSPKEIIKLAKDSQLQAIAITDHDSVNSIEEALFWGEKYGIEVIPGCEFSSRYHEKWLHILGYFIDFNHTDVKQWCDGIEKERRDNVDAQISKLREAGFYLEKEKVLEMGSQPMPISYGKAIFSDYRNDNNQLINQYRFQENGVIKFCLAWLVTSRPYNVSLSLPDAKEVIRFIVKCGGIPVLAHPAVTLGIDHDATINDFLECGIAGVEAFTTWHKPEQADHYSQFCQRRGIIATCGSDFHGSSKPHIRIGQVCNNSYDVVDRLKSLKSRPAKSLNQILPSL